MSLAVFSRPIDSITEKDLFEIINWPETETVEYKQSLSGRDGKDAWQERQELTEHARNRLFKEVVALANAQGGHVFLGLSETNDEPRRATGVSAIRDCADLASRLEQSASSAIDPPIPGLLIRSVRTNADGSGVVIIRVPQSYAAPHRAPDKECYVRRGGHSQPMAMRDIQDLTLKLARRIDRIESTFTSRSDAFRKWLRQRHTDYLYVLGFRLTAVPVGTELYIDQVYRNLSLRKPQRTFTCQSGSEQFDLSAVFLPTSDRPTIRGTVWSTSDAGTEVNHVILSDGLQEVTYRRGLKIGVSDRHFYVGWVLAHAANLVMSCDLFRKEAGSPECEYGLEFEMLALIGDQPTSMPLLTLGPHGYPLGRAPETPITFPRLSFRNTTSASRILSVLYKDLHDACGATYEVPPTIEILQ